MGMQTVQVHPEYRRGDSANGIPDHLSEAVRWAESPHDRRRPSVLAGPTVRRRRLGIDLRRLREQRSLRLEEVASQLGVAPSTLSRIETGKSPTRTSYLTLMLDLYGIDDADRRRIFMDLAREGQRKGWWAEFDDLLAAGVGDYLGLEAEAAALRAFGVLVVPGLLRTREYGRAVIPALRPELASEQRERLVAAHAPRRDGVPGGAPGGRRQGRARAA